MRTAAGVVVRNGDEYQALTGNQIGVLLLDYLITVRKAKGILPENAAGGEKHRHHADGEPNLRNE